MTIAIFLSLHLHAYPCKVIKVSDGDTITCLKNGNSQIKIRLYGIDAPEKKQSFGQRARQPLASMLAGKTVDIQDCGKDPYGRLLGIIKSNGVNINREMIKDGFAWVYPAFCRKSECQELANQEKRARTARRCLWRDRSPVPPWEWRRKKISPLVGGSLFNSQIASSGRGSSPRDCQSFSKAFPYAASRVSPASRTLPAFSMQRSRFFLLLLNRFQRGPEKRRKKVFRSFFRLSTAIFLLKT